MGIRDFINRVTRRIGDIGTRVRNGAPGVTRRIGNIGTRVRNGVPAQIISDYVPDPETVRPALWSLGGELVREFVVTQIPGGRLLFRSWRGSVPNRQRDGSSSRKPKDTGNESSRLSESVCKFEGEISSLKERICKLERENSEMSENISTLVRDFSRLLSKL